jgi:HTH-type transcriptional regulator, sugar sensing transcriptional regulator
MSLDQELLKLGLSEKEAKIYLATLELGQASVQKIAEKADVNRGTSYSILESLIKKGFCSQVEKDKKTLFSSSSPQSLLTVFELKKKAIEQQESQFKRLMPDLELIHNENQDKPIVRFFEGKSGVLNALTEFVNQKANEDEPFRLAYNKDLLEKAFAQEEIVKYRKMRLNRDSKSKVVYNFSGGEIKTNVDGERYKVNEKKFPIKADIGIFADTLRIATMSKKVSGVLIKDKDIAQTMKTIFELAFLGAKHLESNKED